MTLSNRRSTDENSVTTEGDIPCTVLLDALSAMDSSGVNLILSSTYSNKSTFANDSVVVDRLDNTDIVVD